MTDTPGSSTTSPPLLEQLGALCSLLIHDLANHLCIISGSATFAQMIQNEPERLESSLRAIVQASEGAGHALGSCGELRRGLPDTVGPSDIREVLDHLRAVTRDVPGWSLDIELDPDRKVRLPAVWCGFAVRCLIKEVRASHGTITVRRVAETRETTGIGAEPGAGSTARTHLRLGIRYAAERQLEIKEVRARYDHLGLLAAFELNRCLGGRIESRTIAPAEQEVWLELPTLDTDS
jgi:hypothetical protein